MIRRRRRSRDIPFSFDSFLDVVATYDAARKQVAVFALNRDLQNERERALNFEDITPSGVLATETITGPDSKTLEAWGTNPKTGKEFKMMQIEMTRK